MKKVCNICLVELELKEFYANKGMKDGHQNRCIDCTKQKSAERLIRIYADPQLLEKERERHRNKYKRLEYKDKHKPTPEKKKEIVRAYKEKWPEKYHAKNASQRVPKSDNSNEHHHWSYQKEHWKDVIELAGSDHAKIHRFMMYDPEHFLYRRIDTMELLDTREDHESYIRKILPNQ